MAPCRLPRLRIPERKGLGLLDYLDYRWRRRNHRHDRRGGRRGSGGGRGSDRRDVCSDGWHWRGSDNRRLRHGGRDVLERGRRGDRGHGCCLLCSFGTTRFNVSDVAAMLNRRGCCLQILWEVTGPSAVGSPTRKPSPVPEQHRL